MNVAKVFQSGSDRAIRLPDEYRVDADEVYLRRTPEGFLVIPRETRQAAESPGRNRSEKTSRRSSRVSRKCVREPSRISILWSP